MLKTTHFDYTLEVTTNTGETKRHTLGASPSENEAVERFMKLYGEPADYRDWFAVSARVVGIEREHCPKETKLADLIAVWGNDKWGEVYMLTDRHGRVAFSEHGGGHIRTAYEFLRGERPTASWKTVALLTTLRQAFREDTVACHSYYIDELAEQGPTKKAVSAYLKGARCRDHAHHGCNTF